MEDNNIKFEFLGIKVDATGKCAYMVAGAACIVLVGVAINNKDLVLKGAKYGAKGIMAIAS